MKKINKALKFRIYPNKKQIEYFDNSVRTSNFIYNKFLREQIDLNDNFLNNYLNNNTNLINYIESNSIIIDDSNGIFNGIYGYVKSKDNDKKHVTFINEELNKLNESKKKYFRENNLYFSIFDKKNKNGEVVKIGASRTLTSIANQLNENGELIYPFIKEIDATVRNYTLKNLESAFKNMWKTNSGFPKFKTKNSKYSFTGQIQYKDSKPNNFKLLNSDNHKFIKFNIPKLKNIKVKCHIPHFINNWDNIKEYKINSYTISKNSSNQFFISLQVETPNYDFSEKNEYITKENLLGVDFGVERPITTSDINDFESKEYSERFDLIKKYNNERNKLMSILNRKRDYHKKNKSKIPFYETSSYKRIKHKLGIINTKISDVRENRQHNITSKLSKKEHINGIVIEDLKIKNMIKKTGKGLSNNKHGLNRVISDTGLTKIRTQLKYKLDQKGKKLFTVDPKNTSRECSRCKYIDSENRKTQNKFKCVKCGFDMNADLNAAINIKNKFIKNNF